MYIDIEINSRALLQQVSFDGKFFVDYFTFFLGKKLMKMWWFMQSQSFSHCVSLFWQEMNEIFMVLYYRKNMYVENVVLFLTITDSEACPFQGKKKKQVVLHWEAAKHS